MVVGHGEQARGKLKTETQTAEQPVDRGTQLIWDIHRPKPAENPDLGIYFRRVKSDALEAPPMNKTVEILLTALALGGLYCTIPKPTTPRDPVIGTEQTVIVADGSDPMPLCRKRRCGP